MEYKKLDEVLWFQEGPGVRNYQYTKNGIKLINVTNLVGKKLDLSLTDKYLSIEEVNSKYNHFLCKEGDLLVASSGITYDSIPNKVSFVSKSDLPLCMNTSVIRFESLIETFNINYAYYFFKSNFYRDQILKLMTGIAQLNYGPSHLHKVKIPVYKIDKQQEIVSTLDKINAIIDADKKQLELLDETVKSRFIEMFGDPILNDKKIPVKKLKELSIKITNGNTPKGGDSNYIDNGIMFLRSQNVLRNSIDYSDVVYISKDTSDKMKGSVLKNGDILITKTGRYNTENSSLGRPALFEGEDDSANINGHVYLVRLSEIVNKKYILSILLMPQFKDYIRNVCVGGTDKRQLNKDHIEDFPILFPHIDKQNEFANFFEQINNMKEEINNHLKLMNELLDKKMDEYFGGE